MKSPKNYPMHNRALFLDFNGVLIDDEPLHQRLFQEILRARDITLTDQDYHDIYLGYDDKGLIQAIYRHNERTLDPQELSELITLKNRRYFEELSQNLPFFPGAVDFVRRMQSDHLLAVVSGALRSEIDHVLSRAGIKAAFSFIIAAEDTAKGKPHPEGYTKALTRAQGLLPNLTVEQCLVIEDSVSGIESAQAAGLRVWALTHSYSRAELALADKIVDRFDEIA